MGLQDLIVEADAAKVAGVSLKTLQRFSEAGYLHVAVDPEGVRKYSLHELHEIFGAHRGEDSIQPSDSSSITSDTASCSLQQPPVREDVDYQPTTTCSLHESDQTDQGSTGDTKTSVTTDAQVPPTIDMSVYAIETLKLRNVISLQERLLDTKDAEIADLKGQRDWLRARVERLEEKSDRDQILLLSETQTIRKLVSLQEQQKKSGVRQFLEWLGVTPPQSIKALGASPDYANADAISTAKRALEAPEASNG